jgi:hypothetical protein
LKPIKGPARKPFQIEVSGLAAGILRVGPIALAESVAKIEAEIEPAPVVDGKTGGT